MKREILLVSLVCMAFLVSGCIDTITSPEQAVKSDLEDMGYEVMDVGSIGTSFSYVDVKSLGSREEQVWDDIIPALEEHYPEVERHTVWIIEPTQKCWYSAGSLYKAYRASYDKKIYVDENGHLDGYIIYNVVNHTDELLNAEEGYIGSTYYMDMYRESYPELTSQLLYGLAKYEVLGYTSCK
jgi:hypothetical protein